MVANNPYNGRFRWWYPAIADLMIAHPGTKQEDIARQLGKHPNTVSLIMNSDLFKSYYEERRREHADAIDASIRDRLGKVANRSLDLLFESLETKRGSVPIKTLSDISIDVLDRLGYAPKQAPQVQINQNSVKQVLIAPVSVSDLEEARKVLRAAEAARASGPILQVMPPSEAESVIEVGDGGSFDADS
jgi:hypothetical protein